jgi:parallel beta-helix repeat protein
MIQPHSPIKIVGDAAFTAANGVVGGNGSPSNPFVIQGWDIDTSSTNGIDVRNTSSSFIIRNVSVHSANYLYDGIYLNNTQSGRLENSTIYGNFLGAFVGYSANITIIKNNISFNGNSSFPIGQGGLAVSWASNITIMGNTASHEFVGIGVGESKSVIVSNNTVNGDMYGISSAVNLPCCMLSAIYNNIASHNYYGIEIGQSLSTVVNNTLTANRYGIWLYNANGINVSDNTITGNIYGVGFDFNDANEQILANNFTGNEYGVYSQNRACCSNISGNRFESNYGGGIEFNTLESAFTITNNYFLSNGKGIEAVYTSNDQNIIGNGFYYNGVGVAFVQSSVGSHVYNNTLYANNIQASDDSGGPFNYWNTTYPQGGNYWSSYTGVDRCSGPQQNICNTPDGIGDTPYSVTAYEKDNYPLMKLRDSTAPYWPTWAVLSVSRIKPTNATLTWPKASDDTAVIAYKLYQNNTLLTTLSRTNTSYVVTSLSPNTAYKFELKAEDVSGNWTQTGLSATFTTPPQPPTPTNPNALLSLLPILAGIAAIMVVGVTIVIRQEKRRRKKLVAAPA